MDAAGCEPDLEPGVDQELMSQFYQCCELAFESLEERWWRRLYGFFRRNNHSVEDAEDLTLDTLVRLYQTKERLSFDFSRPLEPFLFTIAHRIHLGKVRKDGHEPPPIPLDSIAETIAQPEPAELPGSDALYDCIHRLPEGQRAYVMMCGKHGLGELSHNEIATVLEKWPAQVTQLSQRARAALKKCMSAKGYGSDPVPGAVGPE